VIRRSSSSKRLPAIASRSGEAGGFKPFYHPASPDSFKSQKPK
jgi:hypothetical protein